MDQFRVTAVDVYRQPRAESMPGEVDRSDPERADKGGDRIGVVGKAETRWRVSGAAAAGCVPGDER